LEEIDYKELNISYICLLLGAYVALTKKFEGDMRWQGHSKSYKIDVGD